MTERDPETHPGPSASWPFRCLAMGCVILAVALAYRSALDAQLLFDSAEVILGDPRLGAWEGQRLRDIVLGEYWFQHGTNLYRPLTTLSYAVNASLLGSGTDPRGYVAWNLVVHGINALLLLALGRALGAPRLGALLGALLFAVHPLFTEAVTNVVGRADLMAATGVLGGLVVHARIQRDERFRPLLSLLLALCAGLAIGSKESGVVLIGALALWDLVVRGRIDRASWIRSYGFCLAPVAVWALFRAQALPDVPPPEAPPDNPLLLLSFPAAAVTAGGILVRYLLLLVWPRGLSADYSYDALPLFGRGSGLQDGLMVIACLLLSAVVVAAWWGRRRAPALAFGVLLFFVTIAPVANVFLRIGTIMAERLSYLPSAGLVLLAGWGLGRAIASGAKPLRFGGWLAALVLLAVLGWRCSARNHVWHSGLELFRATVEAQPRSFKANKSFAAELYRSVAHDDALLRQEIASIVHHAETAWEIARELPEDTGRDVVLTDLATLYRARARVAPEGERPARLREARDAYREVLADEDPAAPRRWRAHLGLAETLRDLGTPEEALAEFAVAADLAPGPEVLVPYAALLVARGRAREGLLCAIRVITLDPGHASSWELVESYYAGTKPGELTVVRQGDTRLFNVDHPQVAGDLAEAARLQYRAQQGLGPQGGAENYRRIVRGSLGVDPAQ